MSHQSHLNVVFLSESIGLSFVTWLNPVTNVGAGSAVSHGPTRVVSVVNNVFNDAIQEVSLNCLIKSGSAKGLITTPVSICWLERATIDWIYPDKVSIVVSNFWQTVAYVQVYDEGPEPQGCKVFIWDLFVCKIETQ